MVRWPVYQADWQNLFAQTSKGDIKGVLEGMAA